MLNRVKKILIMAVISASLTGIVLASQSTVSYININNIAYEDIEIVLTDDSKILVPFKQLANIFNIKYNANRVDKLISFKTIDGKEGVVNQHGVFIEDYPVSKVPAIFLTQGIMEGTFNEAYIPADVAEKGCNVKLETDYENFCIYKTQEHTRAYVKIFHFWQVITFYPLMIAPQEHTKML